MEAMSLKSLIVPSLNQYPLTGKIPSTVEGERIPRIIHQTYYQEPLPPALADNVDRIKALNPNWEYRFYNDADIVDFIASNFPAEVLVYFERINPHYGAARADFFRYLVMYKVGGVYLDIKSTALLPLDTVIRSADRFILSTWDSGHEGWGKHHELKKIGGTEYQQWFIASAPGHPFMRNVIEHVMRNIDNYVPSLHGHGKPAVLRVTGPIAYSLAIHPMLARCPHRIVDSQSDLGFQYSVFNGNTHKAAFKTHYSVQTHPLVRLTPSRRYASHLLGALQKTLHALQRLRK
jgi:hypothetical protein